MQNIYNIVYIAFKRLQIALELNNELGKYWM